MPTDASRIIKRCLLAAGLPAALALPASAATFTVTESVWGTESTVGSFAWAIKQANDTAGVDIIQLQLSSGNSISVDGSTPVSDSFLSRITESVQIHGNGLTLLGNPTAVTTGGTILNKFTPQPLVPGDVVVTKAFSFAEVAPSVSIEIRDLNLNGLNGFLRMGANSVATVVNSAIQNAIPYGFSGAPVFEALSGSTLNLSHVVLDRINPLKELVPSAEFAWVGAIAGTGATLNMVNSIIQGTSTSIGGVNWLDGTANVVSSIITGNAGGLSISGSGAVLNFVNSLYSTDGGLSPITRIQAYAGGVANLIASTVQVNAIGLQDVGACPSATDYACNGVPLQAFDGGQINLSQSVVSTLNSDLAAITNPYSETFPGYGNGDLTADALSYVQSTTNLDAAALQALFNQPALLTGSIPYELTPDGLFYTNLPEGAALVEGSPLRSAIGDADGANQLFSPIDGSVIATDVYGNPRTAFGSRDIGAVQSTQVPGPLPVLGVAAAYRWSRRLRKAMRSASC